MTVETTTPVTEATVKPKVVAAKGVAKSASKVVAKPAKAKAAKPAKAKAKSAKPKIDIPKAKAARAKEVERQRKIPISASAKKTAAAKSTVKAAGKAALTAAAKAQGKPDSGSVPVKTMARTYLRDGKVGRGTKIGNTFQVSISFPPAIFEKLAHRAKAQGISLSEQVRQCVVSATA